MFEIFEYLRGMEGMLSRYSTVWGALQYQQHSTVRKDLIKIDVVK